MMQARRLAVGLVITALSAGWTACRTPADSAAPDSSPLVSVTVAPVRRATLHAYVQGWGRVEPEPSAEGRPAASARVAAPISGLVTVVSGREGQRVAQGTVLFRLDSRVADVAVERARQAVAVAEQLVRRQEQLGPGQATSQKAYQEAAAQLATVQTELRMAELQRSLLEIQAPISGTLVAVNSRIGDTIDPSTTLAAIIDLDRLVVTVSIRSVDVGQVRRGQRLEILTRATDQPSLATSPAVSVATVGFIASQVDAATDTVQLRARISGGAELRPGQFVTVRVVTDERRDRLVVPVESIVGTEGVQEVAVVEGDVAVKTRVTVGLREDGVAEVQGDRLREGASVVVRGAYGLPATSRITVVDR